MLSKPIRHLPGPPRPRLFIRERAVRPLPTAHTEGRSPDAEQFKRLADSV